MAQVTFTNHYKAGHSYQETWESTLIHCPKCGRQGVWKDTSGGDYYVGEQHICPGCEFSFHMPSCGDCRDHNDQQRLVAIRGYKPELPMGSALETPPARPCVWRTGCKHPAACDQQGVCVPGGEATDCTCTDYPGTDELCTAHDFGKLPPDTF